MLAIQVVHESMASCPTISHASVCPDERPARVVRHLSRISVQAWLSTQVLAQTGQTEAHIDSMQLHQPRAVTHKCVDTFHHTCTG